MHFIYNLLAFCIVFSLVLASPTPKLSGDAFDDLAFDPWYNVGNVVQYPIAEETGLTEVIVPKVKPTIEVGLIPTLLSCIPKIFEIKAKIIKVALVIIKWLAPKTILLAIGAVATFALCKLTNLCSALYTPAVYSIPSQVRDLVTPQVMEDAQQYLVRALQQYARQ